MKKVHIIGIVGTIGTGLALALKKSGWQVTGSDQEKVYPPLTDILRRSGIKFQRGYKSENLPPSADLVVAGGHALILGRQNPEYQLAKEKKIPLLYHAEAVARFVVRPKSIVVAGSYGKTTITSILVAIFKAASKKPSYMIGGLPLNRWPPLAINESSWSIVEGDEYRISPSKPRAKFFLYSPRYLLLTAAHWEHPDVYPHAKDYLDAFRKLVKKLPGSGFVIANYQGENLRAILGNRPNITWYSRIANQGDYWLEKWWPTSKGMDLTVGRRDGAKLNLRSPLMGEHNAENILAAAAMAWRLGIGEKAIQRGIKVARGVKKRLEFKVREGGVFIYEDFSQTAPRIKAALAALRRHFPKRRVLLVFYPHYSGWRDRSILRELKGVFSGADYTWISRVHFDHRSRLERVTGKMIVVATGHQNRIQYAPDDKALVKDVCRRLRKGDLLVFMSSGGYRNIEKEIVSCLKGKRTDG